jgi:hypothetical protein
MIGANRVLVRHVLENFEKVQDQTVQFLLRNYSRVVALPMYSILSPIPPVWWPTQGKSWSTYRFTLYSAII